MANGDSIQQLAAAGGVPAPIAAPGQASPETIARAQAITDAQQAELQAILAAGFRPVMVNGQLEWVQGEQPQTGPTVTTNAAVPGAALPHLQTAQSQRAAGTNFLSGGGGGPTAMSRPPSGGAPVRQDPVQSAPSALERLLEDFQRQQVASAIASGPTQALPQQQQVEGLSLPRATPQVQQQSAAVSSPPTVPLAAPLAAAPSIPQVSGQVASTTQDQVVQQSNPDAMALLSSLIQQGGSPATRQSSQNQQAGQQQLLATLGNLAGLAAGQTTAPLTGALQGISREFRETVFPQITRSAEAGGSSQGALRALLEQDALARQQEVQSQVALQAQQQAAQNQATLANALQNLGQVDPLSQELQALLAAGARLPEMTVTPLTTASAGLRFS